MTMDERDRFSQNEAVEANASSVSMADFDEAEFRPYLDGLDLTDEQASQLMRVVWDMMSACIEMELPLDDNAVADRVAEAMRKYRHG